MAIQIRSTLIFFRSRTTTLWTDRRFNEFHLRAGQVADLGIGQIAYPCPGQVTILPPDPLRREPGTFSSLPAGRASFASPAGESEERRGARTVQMKAQMGILSAIPRFRWTLEKSELLHKGLWRIEELEVKLR